MGRLKNKGEEEKEKIITTIVMMRGNRRKGNPMAVKSWMVVSKTGESSVEDVDKHSIMRRTGLPARDLRVLDPMLSHPSTILGRDRAIVVNLEHIQAIITSNEVLMINSSNPLFIRFLQDLQSRVPPCNDGEGDREEKLLLEEGSSSPTPKQLPFEFKALEACIESACMCLESETRRLEEQAYPALDELTSHITTLNLERVRQIKNRLVALSGRVQKVADQLEHLLDDDNDMAEMYLTQKLDARSFDQTSLKEGFNPTFDEDIDESDVSEYSVKDKLYGPKLDVEELEMLLEAYFAQINGILQKLTSLSEYVDDTEDYINIMLDDKQNQLLQVSIIFNTINMIVNAGIVVVGLFGMNIHISLFDGQPRQFVATASGTVGGCIFLVIVSIWWGKKRYFFSQ